MSTTTEWITRFIDLSLGVVQQAEVIESTVHDAKIVFHDPIPRGKYNLVVGTRCGEGKDYILRRIGHSVRAV